MCTVAFRNPLRQQICESTKSSAHRRFVSGLHCVVPVAFVALFLEILFGFTSGIAQPSEPGFQRMDVGGISQNIVRKIVQDHYGYLWFGTDYGLFRYDGFTYVEYDERREESTEYARGTVTALIEDHLGNIWVGTSVGTLDRLDKDDRSVTRWGDYLLEKTGGKRRSVMAIAEDTAGHIWVGSIAGGMVCIDPVARKSQFYFSDSSDFTSLSSNQIRSLLCDRFGTLWVGTLDGLNRYDPVHDRFSRFRLPLQPLGERRDSFSSLAEDSSGSLWCVAVNCGLFRFDRDKEVFSTLPLVLTAEKNRMSDEINVMTVDQRGILWLGTWESGLLRYDGTTMSQLAHQSGNQQSLADNEVTALMSDQSGVLWVGTINGGVSKKTQFWKDFRFSRLGQEIGRGRARDRVWALCEDHAGDLWIGTSNGTLYQVAAKSQELTPVGRGEGRSEKFQANGVTCIYEDRHGLLWIGTSDNGLFTYKKSTRKFAHYAFDPNNATSLGDGHINTVCEDSEGTLWVATSNGGLNKLDRGTGKCVRYKHESGNANSLSTTNNNVACAIPCASGGVWIGTYGGGIDKLVAGKFTHYRADPGDPRSLSDNLILVLFEDAGGTLWAGTQSSGLDRLEKGDTVFTRYTSKEGLFTENVDNIREDGEGNIWFTSFTGLARINKASGKIRNYDAGDGLQAHGYAARSSVRLATGEILFGGGGGIERFFPERVMENPVPPSVFLTSFSVTKGQLRYQDNLERMRQIDLDYDQTSFSIGYAALDYGNPLRMQYAYMLEGFDHDWTRPKKGHEAFFTNVEPGNYVFRVVASNGDGVRVGREAFIRIVVVPPPWSTWWAYTLYALVAVGALMGFVRLRTLKHTRALAAKEHELHEQEVREVEISTSLREKELMLKEIHHRVKNNLQVISSLLNLQSQQTKDPEVRNLLRESQDRLRSMALIHEKLYRSESFSSIDFSSYLHDITVSLKRAYAVKAVIVDVKAEALLLSIDIAIPCGLIVNELVSNAFKHAFPTHDGTTYQSPQITVEFNASRENCCRLAVSDNGIGIPKSIDLANPGTLGFQLVQTLAEQLGGSLTVVREGGTSIAVEFPIVPKAEA